MNDPFLQKIKEMIPFESNIQRKDSFIDIEIYQTTPLMKTSVFEQNQKIIYMYSSLEETLDEIKSRIDAHLKIHLTAECPLCCKNHPKNNPKIFRVSCPRCAYPWCNTCYLKIIRKSAIYHLPLKCPDCCAPLERTSFMEALTI